MVLWWCYNSNSGRSSIQGCSPILLRHSSNRDAMDGARANHVRDDGDDAHDDGARDVHGAHDVRDVRHGDPRHDVLLHAQSIPRLAHSCSTF